MTREGWRRGIPAATTALLLFVTAFFFYLCDHAYFALNRMGYDEGFFVWSGWSITRGLTPYRDFVEFKPPVVFITHAFAQLLFGLADHRYRRLFFLLPMLGSLAVELALLSRRVSRPVAFVLVCSFIYLFVNPDYHQSSLADSESIGVSYFLWGLALFLWQSPHPRVTDAGGAFFMCACVLCKEPFAPEVGFTWVTLFFLRGGWQRGDASTSAGWPMLRSTLLGIAVFFTLCVLYLGPTGGLSAYLEMTAGYARAYRDPLHSYCVVSGRFHPTTPLGDLLTQFAQIRVDYLNWATVGFVAPLALLSAIVFWRRSAWLLASACATLLAAMWAVTASNCQWMHYYNMTDCGLLAVLASGAVAAVPELAGRPRWARVCTQVVIAGVAALVLVPRFWSVWNSTAIDQSDLEPLPGIVAAIDALSRPDERVFTTGPPHVYFMANRRSASRFSTFDDEILNFYTGDTDADRLRPIRDELDASQPALVFLDPEKEHRKARTLATLVMPFLEENHYIELSPYLYRHP